MDRVWSVEVMSSCRVGEVVGEVVLCMDHLGGGVVVVVLSAVSRQSFIEIIVPRQQVIFSQFVQQSCQVSCQQVVVPAVVSSFPI